MATTHNVDLLPSLADDYPLSDADIASYRRDGHVVLRHVASVEEVAPYRTSIERAVERYNTETRPLEERDTYGKSFLQVWALKDRDTAVRRYVLARRFAKIAADLMGAPAVRIFGDQALFKEPGGGPTPWHQDHPYWPIDTDDAITMWMPLIDISVEMGGLEFASTSHTAGRIDAFLASEVNSAISDDTTAFFDDYIRHHGLRIDSNGPMAAGDASFHNGWTIHRAEGNGTSAMREVMTVIYMADGALALEPDNDGARLSYEVELSGVKPGELAAGPGNPLVYSRERGRC